jgi:geranylgeranyl diphosphate synthase, type II
MMDIRSYLLSAKQAVDACLEQLLPAAGAEPSTIHRAMRHSVFAGGKRVRPVLVLAAGQSLSGNRETLLRLGAAVEMIHTYSLIHDDLPALDNDDLRRGRPTCHKVFGDATAILAGDALLTLAFYQISVLPGVDAQTRIEIVLELARAAGTLDGMIGGQVVDLESEGTPVSPSVLEYIHRSKTGALLTACTRCGALAAGADAKQLAALTDYGQKVGLAFQIVDDILDVTESTEELGKTAGKDEKVQKATYPGLYGLEASLRKARELSLGAVASLEEFGPAAEPLRALAGFIVSRTT